MVLLPKESVERLQGTHDNGLLRSVQTPGTFTSRLDAEMDEILHSPTSKDEREKWSRYRQLLKHYLHFKDVEVTPKKIL